MEPQQEIGLATAAIIREKSKAGQLAKLNEIVEELTGQGFLQGETEDQRSRWEQVLRELESEGGDIKKLFSRDGVPHYYSTFSMSEAYAGMLVRRNEHSLIAEIVRENSEMYPRPVPLSIFSGPPFELSDEEIADCMEKMAEDEAFQDIGRTTTSIGTTFLYSNQSLDTAHAAALAEWLDVGQMNNP